MWRTVIKPFLRQHGYIALPKRRLAFAFPVRHAHSGKLYLAKRFHHAAGYKMEKAVYSLLPAWWHQQGYLGYMAMLLI
jgi:hypothetical protein